MRKIIFFFQSWIGFFFKKCHSFYIGYGFRVFENFGVLNSVRVRKWHNPIRTRDHPPPWVTPQEVSLYNSVYLIVWGSLIIYGCRLIRKSKILDPCTLWSVLKIIQVKAIKFFSSGVGIMGSKASLLGNSRL